MCRFSGAGEEAGDGTGEEIRSNQQLITTHLSAFVFHLKFRKVEYTPVLIEDMAYYNAILNRTTGNRK